MWGKKFIRSQENVKFLCSVAVADESLTAFNDLKLGKKYKFILFGLNDAKTEIVVKETSTDPSYDAFLEKLPENDCLYAIYDFEYEINGNEGKRSKIVFFTWSPDTAPVRSKMVYASSKDALRRALNGVSTDVQGTDFSEVSYDSVLERVSRGAGSH
ncbi:AQG_2a_G0035070.mRNA.1.CDS.1 [Saccharomyces cerevisiae]|jgi:cofilin|uniref:Cofilin n=1 Tax=Saccharomyces cerevisiae (strain JAY291) TaxID=574961 RepID=C7GNE5_YEAS2|nr:Cof1p [Saccharomyces cerevisiae JAY291]EGA77789.1 Cof1p [Saccharomyces cerevisiae Vin13]EGA85866.1 Cof1p [Saccharomyces cerevisiae VL3]KAJ1047582.1 hypothetical protein FZC28_6923g4766 [Saccharomyces cerevisiae]KOH48895.1 COF1p Cofilin, involved in pH-dependent actin filament depolarization [Saccharomyces boulardii (nom. inval.)]